jgi:hypothetical protein
MKQARKSKTFKDAEEFLTKYVTVAQKSISCISDFDQSILLL